MGKKKKKKKKGRPKGSKNRPHVVLMAERAQKPGRRGPKGYDEPQTPFLFYMPKRLKIFLEEYSLLAKMTQRDVIVSGLEGLAKRFKKNL